MIVVSDASPIIALSAVGQISLLGELFGGILIPDAVLQEITAARTSAPGVAEVGAAEWIRARTVRNRSLVQALRIDLDPGEAEAVALAVETEAALVLMDERRGRVIAQRIGLSVVGVLGLLVEAKERGHLATVRPVLDSLDTRAGFRVSRALYDHVLTAAGEDAG